MRPVPVSGMVNPIIEEEQRPLLDKRDHSLHRYARTMMFATVAALSVATAVFIMLGILVWRLNSSMHAVEASFRPHANAISNATVEVFKDLGSSIHNVHDLSRVTKEAAEVNFVPLNSAVNSSSIISQRLANLLTHPVLRLSLED